MDDWIRMKECMTDAGCSDSVIQRAEYLYKSNKAEDLVRCLRSCRCDVLEEIHEKQKKLDQLDQLIRDSKNM